MDTAFTETVTKSSKPTHPVNPHDKNQRQFVSVVNLSKCLNCWKFNATDFCRAPPSRKANAYVIVDRMWILLNLWEDKRIFILYVCLTFSFYLILQLQLRNIVT